MNLKFRFFKTKSNFKAYYLLPYYSFWRKEIDIGNYNVQCREFVLKFKDGLNVPRAVDTIIKYCLIEFGEDFFTGKIVVISPASTRRDTERRFRFFCELLCEKTDAKNGYYMISNSSVEKRPKHKGGESLQIKHLSFNGNFKDKNLIVFDDVYTKGHSSSLIHRELLKRNPNSMIFLFLAKTVLSKI